MTATHEHCISVMESRVLHGDCLELIPQLPDASIDVVVTSPPYWGQRESLLNGTEEDPRDYLAFLEAVFGAILPKLKKGGIVWLNLGDSYNTPVNWGAMDYKYSSLGPDQKGFAPDNAAYVKPRFKRKAFVDKNTGWLQYGNLLMLPQRLLIALTESGYLYRGEVIWAKTNAMPEGRCRRPHRKHESIYLLTRSENHSFRVKPPVPSVWQFAHETITGLQHRSRFPTELPRRCIEAYGKIGSEIVVLDPFSGSGSTGVAALQLGCTFVGIEIDADQVAASRNRLADTHPQNNLELRSSTCDSTSESETGRNGHLDL